MRPTKKTKAKSEGQGRGWDSLHYIVYFILCPELGRVKIGWTSDNPNFRLDALKTASPAALKPLGMIRNKRGLEGLLHGQFKELRRHGEWFEFTQELADYIRENAEPWPDHCGSFAWGHKADVLKADNDFGDKKEPPRFLPAPVYLKGDQDDEIPCPGCGGMGLVCGHQCPECGGTGLDADR